MPKLYQFTAIFIIILFVSACDATNPTKKDTKKANNTHSEQAVDDSSLSGDTRAKLRYAEQLFANAQSSSSKQKGDLLSQSLLICTQLLIDSQDQTNASVSAEQYDYSLQLTGKIMAQLNSLKSTSGLTQELTPEQQNQYRLATAAISLVNYQAEQSLMQLDMDFDSIHNVQWAQYYQLRAMANAQQGQAEKAVKELIIRHGYLTSANAQQDNANLIWNYLANVDLQQANILEQATGSNANLSNSDRAYLGWVKLAKILRDSHDPQTMNHAINFWLQSYPGHQANRSFINNIIKTRQASVLNIQHIAVLLPLQGKLAKPAKAIRDGIMASHYKTTLSANIELRFYDTSGDTPIWQTYQQAIDNGADFVIGPLAKSNLEALSDTSDLSVPTLALNSLEVASDTNNANPVLQGSLNKKQKYLYQFGLSPESAAQLVAKKARQDGHYYAAIMAPDNVWGQRMNTAFTAQWQALGGVVVDTVAYESKSHDFSKAIKSMLNIDLSEARKREVSRTIGRKLEFTPRRRQDIDMLFMAAFPRQAKQIPLQITYHHGETIPIYSTAHIVSNYQNARQNIDMDGVSFPDMPFLLGTLNNSASQQNTYQNTLYQRLFALGVDSYQLAPYVDYLYKNPAESFSGDTGKISINSDGHIVRALPWASFKRGEIRLENTSSKIKTYSNNHAALN
ncbi:penicillin-binding protein activator [sulfur-oxidizing endosymbiont of Gigantopelta aegis]|uniref:penicillin-binding protein activator n=1 Tax=sulfur-oxidizing endosymbiont of Gigantopelta aegis TaxID=2794934 RepID=UPI0018DBB630|nr:penicillin-binding protein activator [sulfur-oxidizing endosymbiont of Gigantopelta aegis]